jgi:hypothetical protein
MTSPTLDPTGQRSYRSTPESLITREEIKVTSQELKAELRKFLSQYDLSFTLEVLADIADSASTNSADEDESISWKLDALLIRSMITHILH